MAALLAKYNFDRSKPFYPIIISYVLQLHAIKEIAAIGLLGSNRSWNLDHVPGGEEVRRELQQAVEKLLGPLDLAVANEPKRISIPIDEVAKEFVNNHNYLLAYQVRAALNALVMAHEVTKNKLYRDKGPKWEFLRHSRNAAAHNGHFHLLGSEPCCPAEWRSISIVPSMHGQPLLTQMGGAGYLELGDVIALLWDIETEYPAITL